MLRKMEELAMLRTLVSSFLFAIFLTSGAAAEKLAVNKSEWDRLSVQDQQAIKKALQDSRLIQDVDIVPSENLESDLPRSDLSGLQDVPPQSADWWNVIKKTVLNKACSVGCDASGVGAVTACGAISGGTAAVICGGIVKKAEPLCKKLCK
jgi:hypothetical protein